MALQETHIGISKESRTKVAEGLSVVLADSYTLYLKTHNFHWNVTGPMFHSLHTLFEQHYTELAIAVDVIAERIRALGAFAPGTFAEFKKLRTIEEDDTIPAAIQMIESLADAHEKVSKSAMNVFPLADEAEDQVTMDLLTQRMTVHQKTAWMLRSMLEK
ncbi:MAG: Dps family protein [Bacteroidota bacterium]